MIPAPGVAHALALERGQTISDLRYHLALDIVANPAEPLVGKVELSFRTSDDSAPVIVDFDAGQGQLLSAWVNGQPSPYSEVNGHIVLPGDAPARTIGVPLRADKRVELAFRMGDVPLNRRPEFLYSLFVPANARLAFPCFDQPDLKARFTLELTIPAEWTAVSNAAKGPRESVGEDRVRVRFAETEPIPTYLFAFAAGKFRIESAERGGRTYRMLHRESDAAKLARNIDAIFDLHSAALAWLEDYTAIPCPFGKFDVVLIPSFQFGGMEHPGAIFYNAASLLLDESATEHQRLARAHLIAHETAHMWFGDFVTMRWFDDVWMKEVFANLMAAKIVNPLFPDLDHELRFLVSHYPAAYSVDRTAGTHPIRQDLGNLKDAGSLYGSIIYQKAPIVMRQLEDRVGPDRFRDALRRYLTTYAFNSASWPDLARILTEVSGEDIASWSRTWIESAGLSDVVAPNVVSGFSRAVAPADAPNVVPGFSRAVAPDVVSGFSRTNTLPYGVLALTPEARASLLNHLSDFPEPYARGAACITLWEELLSDRVRATAFFDAALLALTRERVEQNVQLVAGYVQQAFWRFLSPSDQHSYAVRLEMSLGFTASGVFASLHESPTLTATRFAAFRAVATTHAALHFLERAWRREVSIDGVRLSETDEMALALELSVRSVPESAAILDAQAARMQDGHLQSRFAFVAQAASTNGATRDAFFQSLRDKNNRRHEPWVVEGLRWLNHPLRAADALTHLRPSLDLLEEIQRTGDIFFPKNWLDAALSGHSTPEAAAVVRGFLEDRPDYPQGLRRIVLQTSDTLLRRNPVGGMG